MLNTPILLLIFNRPDTTAKVFEAIKKQKPKMLYVAADGPRKNREGEIELCKQSKEIIQQIDWECELKTLFRNENLGCKIAIKQSIDWFFESEECGIILEDDCLPEDSFFLFCEKMLVKYEKDEEIMMISGTNYLFGKYNDRDSYYKSSLTPIWGWATWKNAWGKMELDIEEESNSMVSERYKNKTYSEYLLKMFEDSKSDKISTWAIYWLFSVIKNSGYSIIPLKNQRLLRQIF